MHFQRHLQLCSRSICSRTKFFIFLCVGLTILLVLFQSSVGWSRSDQKAENWWRKRKTNVNKKANWKIPHHWMIESRFTQTEELIQKRGCWFLPGYQTVYILQRTYTILWQYNNFHVERVFFLRSFKFCCHSSW